MLEKSLLMNPETKMLQRRQGEPAQLRDSQTRRKPHSGVGEAGEGV
jgi:hypothetical protein